MSESGNVRKYPSEIDSNYEKVQVDHKNNPYLYRAQTDFIQHDRVAQRRMTAIKSEIRPFQRMKAIYVDLKRQNVCSHLKLVFTYF